MDRGNWITSLLLVASLSVTGCSVLPSTETGSPATASTVSTPVSLSGTRTQSLPDTVPASVPTSIPIATKPLPPSEAFPQGASVLRGLLGTISSLDPQKISLSSEEDLARYTTGSLYIMAPDPLTGLVQPLAYHAASPVGSPSSGPGGLIESQAAPVLDHFLEFTVTLRPGLTWSDGSAVTARDYVFSMARLLEPGFERMTSSRFTRELPLVNGAAYQAGTLSDFSQVGFAAGDDLTLRLKLEKPMSAFDVMRHLTLPFLVKESSDENASGNGPALLGAGPYEVESFLPGRSIRLKKRKGTVLDEINATYYTWDYLDLRSVGSDLAAMNDFYAGKLDLVAVSGTAFRALKDDPRLQVVDSNTVWGIYVNTGDPSRILADPDFRQALYWGTDRTSLSVGLFGSYSSYSGFVGPLAKVEKNGKVVSWRKTRESKANVSAASVWDPARARIFADLALGRMRGSQTVELLIPEGDEQMAQLAQTLLAQWQELFGGRVAFTIKGLPLTEVYARCRKGDYDLAFGAMGQDQYDPWQYLAVFASDHPLKLDTMASPAFDDLARQAESEEVRLDPVRRLEVLQAMERQLLEELPEIPLFVSHEAYLIGGDLELPFKAPIPGYGLALDMARRRE